MESLIGQTLDSYEILEIIGRGGMGVVFKALDTNLDKIVALKMIDPTLAKDESFVRRFKTEARALAKLDNQNIVGVYALRETRSYFFMVMEYVENRPLSQYIRENGKLKLKEVINISKQLLNAISFAHKAEIIHRDIKPSNVLLCKNGLIKVTDFGLAKLIKSADSGVTVTQARAGTLYYMSPEQVKGLKNVDQRGDIYSLGMTIYEMTVGRVPFDKTDSDFTIQRKIVDGEIPSPITFCKDVPKKLIKIILKSIEKDPDKRYQTADDMLEDIRKFEKDLLEDEKTVIIPMGKGDVKRKSLFQKPVFVISGFLFLIGFALVYFLLIVPGNNNTQKASISLSTHPPNAIIKVNDEVIENSHLDKIVFDNEGDVKLQISKSGFKSIDTLIRTEFGKTISLVFYLIPNPATSGRLSVSTKPSGAKIYVDQNLIGNSPIQHFTTTSGKVNLNINKTGYELIDTSINIIEGKENLFSFTLNKITEFGGLNVTSDPSGAEVFLDWKRIGTTPFDKSELPAGTHQLLIRKNGFTDHKQTVRIPANNLKVIPTVKLTRSGKLTVTTEPADAEIIIDNKSVGKGNYTNEKMNIGEHNVTVRKNGFKSYSEKIIIEANKPPVKILAKLSAVVCKVEILPIPWGNIYVDNQLKEEGANSLYTASISGGSHILKVVHPILGEWIKKIEIGDDTPRKYIINFDKRVRLTIISEPGFANIYINGKLTDYRTTQVFKLKPGSYKIRVEKENYYPSPEKEFNVGYDIYESTKDKEETISFQLKKIE